MDQIKRLKRRLAALALGIAASLVLAAPAWALDQGTYLVTVTPSYKDPDTGSIEDPGNNEAIGQGMTERLCGSVGLLEVDGAGNTYLTVRYYLSQFIGDVGFEERAAGGSSFTALSCQPMQTKEPVEGAADIEEKYGYTDFRMKISSSDSTFRGKAYVEPMGRNVVYFFKVSGARKGSGDFVTAGSAKGQTAGASGQSQAQSGGQGQNTGSGQAQAGSQTTGNSQSQAAGGSQSGGASVNGAAGETLGSVENGINGSGNVDDAVTGIPSKPLAAAGGQTGDEEDKGQAEAAEDYRLDTPYDLSAVPADEARKLAEPILEEAVGITAMAGVDEEEEEELASGKTGGAKTNANKSIMLVLLGLAGGLIICFAVTGIRQGAAGRRAEGRRAGKYEPAGQSADRRRSAGKREEDGEA